MYEYKIKSIDHLVDGDTFDCTVDLGFNILHTLLGSGFVDDNNLVLHTKEKGKYGRYLGIVYRKRKDDPLHFNINECLVKEGFAVKYFGGKR